LRLRQVLFERRVGTPHSSFLSLRLLAAYSPHAAGKFLLYQTTKGGPGLQFGQADGTVETLDLLNMAFNFGIIP